MNAYDSNFDYRSDFIDQWNSHIKHARIWLAVLGILLIAAGVVTAFAPYDFYAFVQGFGAAALVIIGIFQIVSYVQTPEFFRSAAQIITGILNILLGIMLFALPSYLTAGTLVFLLGFLFIVTGTERITYAHRMHYFGLQHTGVGTATGIINIILGLVFVLMPLFSSLVLSYLVAAYLVVGGVTLVIESLFMSHIDK